MHRGEDPHDAASDQEFDKADLLFDPVSFKPVSGDFGLNNKPLRFGGNCIIRFASALVVTSHCFPLFVGIQHPFAGLEPSKGVYVGVRVRTRIRRSTLAGYGSSHGASA